MCEQKTNISSQIELVCKQSLDERQTEITGTENREKRIRLSQSNMRQVFLKAVTMKITVFWNTVHCHLLFTYYFIIIIIIGIQPLGRFGQIPGISQATGMALLRCILCKFLGVVCHCFPPLLDVPTFATRYHEARDRSGGKWNCGQECCPVILPKLRLPRHWGIFYMPQINDMGPTALLPLWRKACWGFFSLLKIRRLRPGLFTYCLKFYFLPYSEGTSWKSEISVIVRKYTRYHISKDSNQHDIYLRNVKNRFVKNTLVICKILSMDHGHLTSFNMWKDHLLSNKTWWWLWTNLPGVQWNNIVWFNSKFY